MLVAISGTLIGAGLVIGRMNIGPGWFGTLVFATATLASGLRVFPTAWRRFWPAGWT